ncbi:hypothetical protein KJ980_03200 [Patescibacteria group bacterium]|nr:hypothetical protein [Patescibacteria group bacterium]MBU4017258.1 hypothetical protein [Patescibacteria group bacterium]MBU4098633.1 hypothetical protein [Patescibacteria group bacterium]
MGYKNKLQKTERRNKQHDFTLSHEDRISYNYARTSTTNEIIEVVNVSFEVLIKGKWHTIIRYDSHHGYLHKHVLLTLSDEKSIAEPVNISGTHSDWLTWAINDLIEHFMEYKKTFFENNSIIDNN